MEEEISLNLATIHKPCVICCVHSSIPSLNRNSVYKLDPNIILKDAKKLHEQVAQTTLLPRPAVLPHLPDNMGMTSWGVHYDY